MRASATASSSDFLVSDFPGGLCNFIFSPLKASKISDLSAFNHYMTVDSAVKMTFTGELMDYVSH